MSTFYVHNFGCRATQADGAALERDLLSRGLTRSDNAEQAELVVLNTCTVTAEADRDARAAIRRLARRNPGCRILVTGCYAQRATQEIAQLPGVSCVVGNSHKQRIADIACSIGVSSNCLPELLPAEKLAHQAEVLVGDIFAHTELLAAPVFDGRGYDKTRPNLKVQDGCDNRCSFCVIPFVRGQSRSLPLKDVVREMNALVAAGFREVVISGINLGRWGRDLQPASCFLDLVRSLLEHTGVERLRLSSVEPMDWTDELIELVASRPRIAKHAHVPLQSGCDAVLRRMHRRYRPWHYADRIAKIRAAIPMAAIGADVMVGFPGETDAEFEENRRFIASLPFTYLHVFTYSERPGTAAAQLAGPVPGQLRRERNRVLRDLAAEKKAEFLRSLVGQSLSTITLSVFENGRTESLTDNYQKLWLKGQHASNQIVRVHVRDASSDALVGSVPDDSDPGDQAPPAMAHTSPCYNF